MPVNLNDPEISVWVIYSEDRNGTSIPEKISDDGISITRRKGTGFPVILSVIIPEIIEESVLTMLFLIN